MAKKISIRGMDEDALEMLNELRLEERRFLGAIVSDAIRNYWHEVFEDDDE